MSPKYRIVFVEQFYYPDGWGGAELPRDLTVHLARIGHDIEVICGSDQYATAGDNVCEDPRRSGVRIVRLPRLLDGDIHSRKLLRQLWFCAALFPKLFFRLPPDLFVSQTNPPLAVPLVAVAAWIWRRPYLLIAMDIYPEMLIAHGPIRGDSLVARSLAWFFRLAYGTADRVVALGPVMAERLLVKGVRWDRITQISNWSTGKDGVVRGSANRMRSEWGLTGKFVLVYSGNLGFGHEFDTVLHGLAQALLVAPDIRLVVIGKGSRLAEVRRLVDELRIGEAVRFSELVPADQLPESIGLADLALVTMRPGFEGLIVPSKVLGYMSRGVPVLYVGPRSDVQVLVEQYGCGVSLKTGDVAGVAGAILDLRDSPEDLARMGEAARAAYDADLARECGLSRYEDVVRECLEPAPTRP